MQSARHLVFRCSIFAVEPGEDAETNPGVYGKALANWLASELRAKGRTIRGCLSEDFGRLVHVAHPPLRPYAACANGHDFLSNGKFSQLPRAVAWRPFLLRTKSKTPRMLLWPMWNGSFVRSLP
jgi:hypothetical protein